MHSLLCILSQKDSDQDKQQTMFRINDEAKVQAWAAEVKAGTDHNKIPLVVMPAGHRQRICKTSGQEIEVQTLKGTSSIQREVLPCFPLEPHAVPTPPRSLHPSLPAKEPSWTVSQQQDLVKIETAQAAKLEQQEMARQQKAESVGSRQSLASPKENNIESKSHQRPLYQPQKACPFPAALTSAKLPTEQDMAVDASMLAGFLKDLGICDPECQRWQIKKERQKSTAKQRPAKHSIGQPGHSNSEEICSAGGHICYG